MKLGSLDMEDLKLLLVRRDNQIKELRQRLDPQDST
jgi:hypothetical protein